MRAWLKQTFVHQVFEQPPRLDAALWFDSHEGRMDIALEWEWDNTKTHDEFPVGDFAKVLTVDATCGLAIIQTRADGREDGGRGTKRADETLAFIRKSHAEKKIDDRPVGVIEIRRIYRDDSRVNFVWTFHDLNQGTTIEGGKWAFPITTTLPVADQQPPSETKHPFAETLRFKALTLENWQDVDPTITSIVRPRPDPNSDDPYLRDFADFAPITKEEWVKDILEAKLDPAVPMDLRRLFEAARGAMCYGVFFSPLFTLAEEQFHRIADAAVTFKCQQVSGPSKETSFKGRVDYLLSKGILPQSDRVRWEAIVNLRNFACHPDFQHILGPSSAVWTVNHMAEEINRLFKPKADCANTTV